MADVGAGAHPLVAAFDDPEDVEGIPDFILGVDRAVLGDTGAVLMDGDLDVELLGGGFPMGDLLGGFGADGVEAHLLGEGHDGVDLFLVLRADDAVINGADALAVQLGLDLGHGGVGHRVVGLLLRTGLHGLSGEDLDEVAAGLLGLGDGFEEGELLEGVGLGADEPAVLAVGFRDRIGAQAGCGGEGEEGEETHGCGV